MEIAKNECCGCGACEQACPSKCIALKEDREGFLYPEVDSTFCISCGKCVQACPVALKNETLTEMIKPKTYGGWHKNDAVREKSSSGGAFTAIAEHIIKEGGIVYGCALNEHMEAVHIGIEDMDALEILRGSKYVQSKIGSVYQEIKTYLEKGRKVLFVGTPCQAAGLHSFLGKGYNNLYVIDFICHGVPSPKLFRKYIDDIERKYKRKVNVYKFRNKDHGWKQSGIQLGSKIGFTDGIYIRKYPAFMDHYMNAFLDDVCLRPSCYACRFKERLKGYSDFTIADFWGVNRISRALNDGKGTSLMVVHNTRASEILDEIRGRFYFEEVDFEQAIRRNRSLTQSARQNPHREKFYEELDAKGWRYVERKYMLAVTWGFHKVLNQLKKK